MSEKWTECPKCHWTIYKYFVDKDTQKRVVDTNKILNCYCVELPVVIQTPIGYLCRLCRHEWRENGTPIEQEIIDKSIARFRV